MNDDPIEYTSGDPDLRPRGGILLPDRMRWLKRDKRGFVIPWFVPIIDGVPEFRAFDGPKFVAAIRKDLCWLCGGTLGRHKIFVVGPMCVINRISGEPPAHVACAEYAAQICPFLTHPKMRRNTKDMDATMPNRISHPMANPRNPGATALYFTGGYRVLTDPEGHSVIRMDAPSRIAWYTKARAATRSEVQSAMEEGKAVLEKAAFDEGAGQAGQDEIDRMYKIAMTLIPPVEKAA
jgi:hypothetical protein